MKKPEMHLGIRHIALFVKNFDECAKFYTDCLQFKVVWQPDEDNLYLSSGSDNLALHRAPPHFVKNTSQPLDHLGLFLQARSDVDHWHDYLQSLGCQIKAAPKDHRDGTRSFYVSDPDGNVIQMIYYP